MVLPCGATDGAKWLAAGTRSLEARMRGLAWSSRHMEPGLNQGRERELERRGWIPEYSGGGLRNGDFVDEGDALGEAMLRLLMGGWL